MHGCRVGHIFGRHNRQFRLRGFTLLELLVVMVIIGMLSAFVGPRMFGQIGKSQTKIVKAQIESLAKALDQYRIDTGHCPSTDQGLQSLLVNPGEARWAGPYLAKALPQDTWRRDYLYRSPGEHGDCDIWSYGRDGALGGEGEDVDISSWQ